MPDTIRDVVRSRMCISCGACVVGDSSTVGTMRPAYASGMIYPVIDAAEEERSPSVDVCPGAGYQIGKLSEQQFADTEHADPLLGRWKTLAAVRTLDKELLERASSGGIMTGIAQFLLDEGDVDGVVVSAFSYTEKGPVGSPMLATTREQLLEAQGSKYCPVPAVEALNEVRDFDGRVLFIGTPCQVAGVALLKQKYAWVRDKVVLTMANFCGGFRSFKETTAIISRNGISPGRVQDFRYRGNGQPGSMMIRAGGGGEVTLPYPQYSRFTGVTKNRRCRLCVDATGELADFSCGDAWIPRFLDSEHAWSLIMTRSTAADEILTRMVEARLVSTESVSIEETKSSQDDNLRSKKLRQGARRRLYRKLGMKLPEFDGGFEENGGSMLFELRVTLSHTLLQVLESMGLYPLFARAIGRYPKELGK